MTILQTIEQLRVQLAGCGVAANGGIDEEQLALPDDYGWSPAYQDVVNLRRAYNEALVEIERLKRLLHPAIADNGWGKCPYCKDFHDLRIACPAYAQTYGNH